MSQVDNASQQSVMGWGIRGWVEIVETILEICENGALKTHVMYKCNLNSKQITQYAHFLQGHKLIETQRYLPDSKRVIFKTTERGRKYMEAYAQLEDLFK